MISVSRLFEDGNLVQNTNQENKNIIQEIVKKAIKKISVAVEGKVDVSGPTAVTGIRG